MDLFLAAKNQTIEFKLQITFFENQNFTYIVYIRAW